MSNLSPGLFHRSFSPPALLRWLHQDRQPGAETKRFTRPQLHISLLPKCHPVGTPIRAIQTESVGGMGLDGAGPCN